MIIIYRFLKLVRINMMAVICKSVLEFENEVHFDVLKLNENPFHLTETH